MFGVRDQDLSTILGRVPSPRGDSLVNSRNSLNRQRGRSVHGGAVVSLTPVNRNMSVFLPVQRSCPTAEVALRVHGCRTPIQQDRGPYVLCAAEGEPSLEKYTKHTILCIVAT